uniref:MDS1 and EVI1 complex locus n=1 Tax=Amphilophus citrinellus TaxID=61819 RepID=A0A3Q0RT88_AMPCI
LLPVTCQCVLGTAHHRTAVSCGSFPAFTDILDDICGSDGDPTPSSALPDDPASPSLSDDESSPQDHLSFQHQSIFFPQEDLSIPFDFELRESTVPGGGLGIWSRRKVNVGERFGPYEGEHRPCLQDPTQGWEVGISTNVCISLFYLQFQ